MSESVKPVDPHAALKRQAAEYAVRYVESGMAVGLGTGSTAIFAVRYIGELLRAGTLRDIVAFATSQVTWAEAVRVNIPMLSDDLPRALDVTIDGADELDPQLNLIKGGGGLREKLAAQNTVREIIVVDESKLSPPRHTSHLACGGLTVRLALSGRVPRGVGSQVCCSPTPQIEKSIAQTRAI